MKQTDMVEIEIDKECEGCRGTGKNCDHGCDMNNCTDTRGHEWDNCAWNCDDGRSTEFIWIPKSVIEEWKNKQHNIETTVE